MMIASTKFYDAGDWWKPYLDKTEEEGSEIMVESGDNIAVLILNVNIFIVFPCLNPANKKP